MISLASSKVKLPADEVATCVVSPIDQERLPELTSLSGLNPLPPPIPSVGAFCFSGYNALKVLSLETFGI